MKSMTAYASAESMQDDLVVAVEIRSCNSRYFDPVMRMPQGYHALEEKIKKRIAKEINRGRVELKLTIRDTRLETIAYEIDAAKAAAFHRALVDLKDRFHLEGPVTLDHFLSVSDMICPVETSRDPDTQWPAIESCVEQAVEALNAMRETEGAYIRKDFKQRLICLEEEIRRIEQKTSGMLNMYQERLKDRIAALMQDTVEVDTGRILQEAAFLADRSDISEELVRARSHVAQFHSIMDSPEPAGRRLNFLLQELNRELNTMGAKVGNSDISHGIVEMKSELEKLREQVQNIE